MKPVVDVLIVFKWCQRLTDWSEHFGAICFLFIGARWGNLLCPVLCSFCKFQIWNSFVGDGLVQAQFRILCVKTAISTTTSLFNLYTFTICLIVNRCVINTINVRILSQKEFAIISRFCCGINEMFLWFLFYPVVCVFVS